MLHIRGWRSIGLLCFLPGLLAAAGPLGLCSPAAAQENDPNEEHFDRSRAVWETFPREAVRGTTVTVQFRVAGAHFGPVLVVVDPDGRPSYLKPTFDTVTGNWQGKIPLDKRGGRHRVSLVVDSPAGDLRAAQFFLHATAPDGTRIDRDLEAPPAETVYEPMNVDEHALRLERILFHRMNGFRTSQGLKPLAWHEGVAEAARKHLPAMTQLYEDSYDPRVGHGFLAHSMPQDGEEKPGPSIAERVRQDQNWPFVEDKLGPDNPPRGRDRINYVSESLLSPDSSLHRKFEQLMLRVSEQRAPMLQKDLTHAAGAAAWRTFMAKRRVRVVSGTNNKSVAHRPASSKDDLRPDEYGNYHLRKPGESDQAFAILVYVQINDPRILERDEQRRGKIQAAVPAARDPRSKADALRTLGRYAFRDSSKTLRNFCDDADPIVRAGALDGLWLCDPDVARYHTDIAHLRIEKAKARDEYGPVAVDLEALALVLYDAATRAEGRRTLDWVRRRGQDALNAAIRLIAQNRDAARAELLRISRAYKGFDEGGEALDALGLLPPEAPGK